MTNVISWLREVGALSAIDAEFARTLARLVGEERDDPVLLGAALASRATREGHVCADLGRLADTPVTGDDGESIPGIVLPKFEVWRSALLESKLVSDGTRRTPLVLDGSGRLYLARYFEDEQRLARALRRRCEAVEPASPADLTKMLGRLFGAPARNGVDFQRLAAQISVVSRLTVITGGPGTGKTTTVAKILALVISDSLSRGKHRPRALLLAPTGKAAARLAEATARVKATLDCPPAIGSLIPDTAQTLHRALGASRPGRPFRFDSERPLYADVVVVDEASMVDVTMMRRLVEAVPDTARLVLLGDHRQLSSVEAGAVLADICGDGAPVYSRNLSNRVTRTFGDPVPDRFVRERSHGISDSIVSLTRSYRFGKASPLGNLAQAVEHGDAEAALSLFSENGDLVLLEPPRNRTAHPALASVLTEGFRFFASSTSTAEALSRMERFRVLSAHRHGPLGVVDMNGIVERLLSERGLLGRHPGPEQLLLVTKNDASIGLFNGDVGVSFREAAGEPLRAYFPKPGSASPRALSPARLPAHEPAFAMSVHKSQGSEFEQVLVALPPVNSPLLVRELLYTAVTRAKGRLVLHASVPSIRQAIERRMVRASGLAAALVEPPPD